MRKQAALWSCIARAISAVVAIRAALGPNHISGIYLMVPVIAFAGAFAIYTGFISGPWFSSLTWLLNGLIAAAFGFGAAFDWRYMLTNQPFRFALMLLLLASSVLNTVVLYPRSPKPTRTPSG